MRALGRGKGSVPLAIDGGPPVRASFLPFGRPAIGEAEIAAVVEVLRSGWIGMGPRTIEFEEAFARYAGARHAVAVSSCTAGLHLALLAAGVGPGDEVVTTAMTFAATVNTILEVGARPVLVDIDPETLNLEPGAVARAVTPRTRALLPVHFGGLACDLEGLGGIARRHGLVIVEDAAHAVGAVRAGTRVGGHGNVAAFSFYPNKNMTTVEGGMVTIDDARQAEEMRLLRLHGLQSDAWKRFGRRDVLPTLVVRLGFKYNLTDVQSALGLAKLARVEEFLCVRERYAAIYDRELAGLPFERQVRPGPGDPHRHALHLYVLLLRLEELTAGRDQVVRALRAENVGAAIHYDAIPEHPFYAATLGCRPEDYPVAMDVSRRTLTLPLGPSMGEDDLADVIDAVHAVLGRYRR